MQLTDAKDTNIILVGTTGMYDVHGGDSYVIVSASLGGSQPFTLLLPKSENGTVPDLPSANDVTMVEATFDMCVSTKRIAKKPTTTTRPVEQKVDEACVDSRERPCATVTVEVEVAVPEIDIRPTDDGKGLEVIVPPARERPPAREPAKPRPRPGTTRPTADQECAFPPCRRRELRYHVDEAEAPPAFDFWATRNKDRMQPRHVLPDMSDNFEPHIYDTHNIYDYLDHGRYAPESDALKITIKALKSQHGHGGFRWDSDRDDDSRMYVTPHNSAAPPPPYPSPPPQLTQNATNRSRTGTAGS